MISESTQGSLGAIASSMSMAGALLHTEGGKSDYFAIGWPEQRRTRRHTYQLHWYQVEPSQTTAASAVAVGENLSVAPESEWTPCSQQCGTWY